MKPASLNIEAYCIFLRHYISLLANKYKSVRILFDLLQQKLYQLISTTILIGSKILIYDSRNYISLLARVYRYSSLSSIYDSRNYISLLAIILTIIAKYTSTIVEIILAYQPCAKTGYILRYLRQQKLYQLISPHAKIRFILEIYDSRNYISLLAKDVTFVECGSNLRQQKLYQLISHKVFRNTAR